MSFYRSRYLFLLLYSLLRSDNLSLSHSLVPSFSSLFPVRLLHQSLYIPLSLHVRVSASTSVSTSAPFSITFFLIIILLSSSPLGCPLPRSYSCFGLPRLSLPVNIFPFVFSPPFLRPFPSAIHDLRSLSFPLPPPLLRPTRRRPRTKLAVNIDTLSRPGNKIHKAGLLINRFGRKPIFLGALYAHVYWDLCAPAVLPGRTIRPTHGLVSA